MKSFALIPLVFALALLAALLLLLAHAPDYAKAAGPVTASSSTYKGKTRTTWLYAIQATGPRRSTLTFVLKSNGSPDEKAYRALRREFYGDRVAIVGRPKGSHLVGVWWFRGHTVRLYSTESKTGAVLAESISHIPAFKKYVHPTWND